MISPAYLEELSLLQDRIAPFATDAALQMIEQELGLPVDLIFSEISPQPVAAASIGQVLQILRAHSFAKVVINISEICIHDSIHVFLIEGLSSTPSS